MARNKSYRNMRVLLRVSDMHHLAEVRDKLQRAEPLCAITDSAVIRKAIRITNMLDVRMLNLIAEGSTSGMNEISEFLHKASSTTPTAPLTKTKQIIATLTRVPRMPLNKLAAEVYGSDSPRWVRRTSALLTRLKHQGRVKPFRRGQWEVVVNALLTNNVT